MHKSSGNTASNGTTPPKKSRVNSSASQMIVNWINILFSGLPSEHLPAPLKSLKDLRDGVVYTKLTIDVVNRHFTDFGEIYRQMPELANDSAKRYECITGVFSSHLGVTAGVDFDAAIEGNELELAKIALILLMNCVRLEVRPYAESCDELQTDDYETINQFYTLMNNNKLAIHTLTVKFYETFLCMSESLAPKDSGTARHRTPTGLSGTSSTARYLISYLSGDRNNKNQMDYDLVAYTNMFLENSVKEKDDHILDLTEMLKDKHCFAEVIKKSMFDTKEKDNCIYELTDQLREKDNKLNNKQKELEETRRNLQQMGKYKQCADECEILFEKITQLEKQKQQAEEKFKRVQNELIDMRYVSGERDQLDAKVKRLEGEVSKAHETRLSLQSELQRLRSVESQLEQAKEDNELKEKKILELLKNQGELENNFSWTKKYNYLKQAEFKESMEEAMNRNASIEGDANLLKKKLGDLEEQLEAVRDEFKSASAQKDAEIEEMRSLAANRAAFIEQQSAEINRLKADIDKIKEKKKKLKEKLEHFRQQTETEKTNHLSKFESMFTNLQNEIKLLSQLVDEKRHVEVATTNLEQSERTISDLKQQLAKDKSKWSQETTQIESQLTEEIESLKSRIVDLDQQKQGVEADVERKKGQIGDLTSRVESVLSQNANLMAEIDSNKTEMSQLRSKLEAETSQNLNLCEKIDSWQNKFNDLIKKNDELNENKCNILDEICNKAEKNLVEAIGIINSENDMKMNEALTLIDQQEQFQKYFNDAFKKYNEMLNQNHELRMKCDMKSKEMNEKLISNRDEINRLSGKLSQKEAQQKANNENLRKFIEMLSKQENKNLVYNVVN